MKNKAGKPKLKQKGATNVFGCELTAYLESSGQDVPLVLRSCAEFIETHGIVDGIYRLSGVTSNIQKLRQEFGSDQCPDLTREVYLQDIHCVGSLCKLYFRELPNPLLTYELYKKFTEAVSCFPEKEQLAQIQNVIQQLPPSHYRTLEYLSKHLALLASFSSMTNMHTRNLALVWAPNLLRSKEIESVSCNGDAAFLEVRVQQLVIEFILNHVDEIFNDSVCVKPKENEENKPMMMKSLTLPSNSLPMKLVSLEEAQARSLSACHPAYKERRENSLPEIVPVTGSFYHTVLDLPDSKRKLSTKSKKWKSIFNLGRSGSEAKTKLSRNGSVFVRGQKISEKATIRPAKSMDSLCSLPVEGDDDKSHFKRTIMAGGFFVPAMKPRMGGPSSSNDLSKQETEWDLRGAIKGAEGGAEDSRESDISQPSQIKPLPEQLKVFRAIEDPENEQTSPKMCRMFYTSNDGTSKLGFHGTLFPLEASPRHQHKALNISEPFAVSVPLRVSAVISINSTPCRVPTKEKPTFSSLQESSFLGKDNAISSLSEGDVHDRSEDTIKEEKTESKSVTEITTDKLPIVKKLESPPTTRTQETNGNGNNHSQLSNEDLTLEQISLVMIPTSQQQAENAGEDHLEIKGMPEQICPSMPYNKELPADNMEDNTHLKELARGNNFSASVKPPWLEIQQELKIVEPEEEFSFVGASLKSDQQLPEILPSLASITSSEENNVVCSSHPLPTLPKEESLVGDPSVVSHILTKESEDLEMYNFLPFRKQGNISFVLQKLENIPCSKNFQEGDDTRSDLPPPQPPNWKFPSESQENTPFLRDVPLYSKENNLNQPECESNHWLSPREKEVEVVSQGEKINSSFSETKKMVISKHLSRVAAPWVKEGRMNDHAQNTLDQQEENTWVDHAQSIELLEPWEDHQWVTSPLHSPTLKETQGKALQEFQPENQEMPHSYYKKPCFSRSFSLDSKDFLKRHLTIQVPFTSAGEEQLCDALQTEGKEHSPAQWREHAASAEDWLNLSEEASTLNESSMKSLGHEEVSPSSHEGLFSPTYKESVENEVHKDKKIQENRKLVSPVSQFDTGDHLLNPSCSEKHTPNFQQRDSPGAAVTKDSCFVQELPSAKSEDIPCKGRPRPSSLNLDSFLPVTSLFNFESLSVPTPPRHFFCGQKEVKSSDSVPSLPVACPSEHKSDLWGSHFDPQDLDLEYIMMAHASTGRRNSAPVSVSAVRTSFMVKMCQARAVPVIPPKIQYTQVPQPLQAQNPNCRTSFPSENKEVETIKCQTKATHNAKGQLQLPKSPSLDQKGKENSSTIIMDSAAVKKTEPAFLNHNITQDAPILRRKRTSEGEATGDNPQSSKMERPSGASKPSYRSRPGRPQSLILFSPPFPIMDHPSSSADSRMLLSPIRSPTLTSSPSATSSDLLEAASEGVTLQNKMTIPKNGQRLETSTSCFYQPQRRSVILDGRSGRPIE